MQLRPQFLILLTSLVALAPALVSSECCEADPAGYCKDRTKGTPCCAYGKCNIFCCNCDDGCREKLLPDRFRLIQDHSKGSYTGSDDHPCHATFAKSDLNGDGIITFGEWALSQGVGGSPEGLAEHWAKFDWEGKGYLTFQEVYERKA